MLLRDAATDELIGGLWGRSLWGSLYIDMMFVPEPLRRAGVGMSLLRQAEQEAMRRGCREMWTNTYAFQARSFYEKAGFTVFGQLDGPAPIFPRSSQEGAWTGGCACLELSLSLTAVVLTLWCAARALVVDALAVRWSA